MNPLPLGSEPNVPPVHHTPYQPNNYILQYNRGTAHHSFLFYFDLLPRGSDPSYIVFMPSIYYQRNFLAAHTYHLYNRGALGSEIFRDQQDFQTFTFILSYYLRIPEGKPLSYLQTVKAPYTRGAAKALTQRTDLPVSLIAYQLSPTFFHLVLEEHVGPPSPGISALMKRLSVTYAMYYNSKYGKEGSLFSGKYKMILVQTLEHLLELTKYLHRLDLGSANSSYQDYLKTSRSWVKPDQVLTQVRSHSTLSYKTFVEDTPANTTFLQGLLLNNS